MRATAGDIIGTGDWDAFVGAAQNGAWMQRAAWAEANAAKGWDCRHVMAGTGQGQIGAQVLVHRMRPGPWSRGYAPRGPVATVLDEPAIDAFTAAAHRAARELRLSHLVIDPEVPAGHPIETWLAAHGWRRVDALQVNRTRIVDLRVTEAALWERVHPKWRQSVRRAARDGFTVAPAGDEALDAFERIYRETAMRVGFAPSQAFRDVYRAFARRGAARMLLGHGPDGVPAGVFMVLEAGGRATSLYGVSRASGLAGRVNYLLEWEVIRTSRERGMESYDMWGTDAPGVATFKGGFGGAEWVYIGAWELVADRLGYGAFLAARAVTRFRGRFDRTPERMPPRARRGGSA